MKEEGNNENLETLVSCGNEQKSPKALILAEMLWRRRSSPSIPLYSWIPLEWVVNDRQTACSCIPWVREEHRDTDTESSGGTVLSGGLKSSLGGNEETQHWKEIKEKLLFPGNHMQIGLHQVPAWDSPRGVLPDGTGNTMTHFFSLSVPRYSWIVSPSLSSVPIPRSSEKELKEGLGCYI